LDKTLSGIQTSLKRVVKKKFEKDPQVSQSLKKTKKKIEN
jgi:hypothetical protein